MTGDLRRHIPNILTLSRLAWACLLFAVLSRWSYDRSPIATGNGPDWTLLLAAALFIIAAATDFLDGNLARRWNVVSVFGRVMDPFADKLLVIGAFVMLAGPGFSSARADAARDGALGAMQVSGVMPWMAVAILGRELLVTSIRAVVESTGVSFAAIPSGKWKMVLQSVCIPAVLVLLNVPLHAGEGGHWPLTVIRVLVWATVLVTLWSGVPYVARGMAALRDPATPSGGLKPMHELWITSFGLGFMRPAPGTWGSLPPIVLAAGLIDAGLGPADSPWVFSGALAAVALAFTAICAKWGAGAEARFGKKDPSQVVADETAGQSLALLALPAASCSTYPRAAATLAIAFLAFRIADILKPFPAHRIQKVPGGWGVVLDDLVAALYALIAVQLFTRLTGW
jgi:phosphatidylglycerophosphate synthase/phosphatidylglycerophosphatase A